MNHERHIQTAEEQRYKKIGKRTGLAIGILLSSYFGPMMHYTPKKEVKDAIAISAFVVPATLITAYAAGAAIGEDLYRKRNLEQEQIIVTEEELPAQEDVTQEAA